MIVVDSSVWVSRFLVQDAHHAITRQWLTGEIASREAMIVPSLGLAEVAGALARRTGHAELGRSSVRLLLRLPMVRVDSVDIALAMTAASVAADLKLRGPDAVFVALAYRLRAPLVTWDHEQALRASSLVSAFQPG